MAKEKFAIILTLCCICATGINTLMAQTPEWKKGILVDEFIFDTAAFPASHAPTIAETPAGLIAAWFGGTKEGYNDVEIRMSRLVDGKWTKPVSIADGIINDCTRVATYNPVLFQVPGGDLLLFYKVGNMVANWRGWMKTSADNGLSWSQPIPLPGGFLGPAKNKPVMQKNGIIIAPSSTENDGWKIHFEISADTGKTWHKTNDVNNGKTIEAIQPTILFHKDGQLQALTRSKQRAIMQCWSKDGGETWSPLTKTNLPNNNSGLDAVTLADGRHLLVYNHVLPADSLVNGKGARTPLNVAVSKDGINWYASLVLEDSPVSQYSYPSVIQSADGMVHIVYTWRRKKIKYVKIDPSQLPAKKIIEGKWPVFKGYKAPPAGEVTDD